METSSIVSPLFFRLGFRAEVKRNASVRSMVAAENQFPLKRLSVAPSRGVSPRLARRIDDAVLLGLSQDIDPPMPSWITLVYVIVVLLTAGTYVPLFPPRSRSLSKWTTVSTHAIHLDSRCDLINSIPFSYGKRFIFNLMILDFFFLGSNIRIFRYDCRIIESNYSNLFQCSRFFDISQEFSIT